MYFKTCYKIARCGRSHPVSYLVIELVVGLVVVRDTSTTVTVKSSCTFVYTVDFISLIDPLCTVATDRLPRLSNMHAIGLRQCDACI